MEKRHESNSSSDSFLRRKSFIRASLFFSVLGMLAVSVIGNATVPQAFAANTLTVNGTALDGKTLNMWVSILQNGSTVKTGFTPLTFAGTTGASYSVVANDYLAGSIFFDHWATGSTSKTTTVVLNADTTITALYKTPVVHNLTIKSADTSGKVITGYYTTIMSGSTTVKTGFTPMAFSGNQGSYTVSVSDYGSMAFDHWSDDSTSRSKTINLNTDTELTVFYKDISVPAAPANNMPSANDDAAATDVDASVLVSVLANDVDSDGDSLTVTSVTDPANGSVTNNDDGTILYAPDAAFAGTDAFAYSVSDGRDGTDTAQVSVTVNAPAAAMHTLAVVSSDMTGGPISGHQMAVTAANATVHSGPTPQSVSLAAGSYDITVQDSSGMVFDHWEDGSTTRTRTIALSADTTSMAYFKTVPLPAPTTYLLTVNSADMQNNPSAGFYTTIRAGSTTAKTGFTSLTFTGNAGTSYTVSVSDYSSSIFDHWENGSTSRSRTVSMTADTSITAYYRKPVVSVSPASGIPGTQVTITGSYFSPGSPITVSFDGNSMTTTPTSVVTSSAGAFTASFNVPSSSAGQHTVKATDNKGWNSQASFQNTAVPTENSLQSLIPKTGVFVALYMYPGSTGSVHWQKVIDEKTKHPSVPIVAAFNPSSGPGSAKDNNIASWVNKLKNAGVIAIGYTYDDYGTRSLTALKADADKYKNWYNADGLFIDEFTNKVGYETHYKDLTTYAKSLGMKMTMGNPGTDVPPSYIGTVTVINTSEGKGYLSLTDPNLIGAGWVPGGYLGWHAAHDKSNFVVIRYDVSTLDTAFVNGASDKVGLIYVTNGNDSNARWFHVPPYFSTLVATLDK